MAIGNAGEKAWSLLSLAFGAVLALLFFHAWTGMMRYATYGSDTIEIPMTTFDGQMWTTNSTVNAVTLASCKYGQFQSHTVRTDNGEIAKEWLWTNDRDQINIMVCGILQY